MEDTDCLFGEIRMFAGTTIPKNWASCEGQTLKITENTALFSLLGTTYGGDGKTTFKLPDLRGRAPMHFGTIKPIGDAGGGSMLT
jgi:microcystin-dependent protein